MLITFRLITPLLRHCRRLFTYAITQHHLPLVVFILMPLSLDYAELSLITTC